MLHGDSSLTSPRNLTKEAEAELQYEQQLKEAFLERIDLLQPLTLYILDTWKYPMALLGQALRPAEWIYT